MDPSRLQQESKPIDGRQFFKIVKQRISADDFQCFLRVIKQCNSQLITNEEAVLRIKTDIFRQAHADLLPMLESIINPKHCF